MRSIFQCKTLDVDLTLTIGKVNCVRWYIETTKLTNL